MTAPKPLISITTHGTECVQLFVIVSSRASRRLQCRLSGPWLNLPAGDVQRLQNGGRPPYNVRRGTAVREPTGGADAAPAGGGGRISGQGRERSDWIK